MSITIDSTSNSPRMSGKTSGAVTSTNSWATILEGKVSGMESGHFLSKNTHASNAVDRRVLGVLDKSYGDSTPDDSDMFELFSSETIAANNGEMNDPLITEIPYYVKFQIKSTVNDSHGSVKAEAAFQRANG